MASNTADNDGIRHSWHIHGHTVEYSGRDSYCLRTTVDESEGYIVTTLLKMYEDPDTATHIGAWVGDFHPYNLALVDAQWSAVDITTGTLAVTFTDDVTGLPYTFPSGTAALVKKWSTEGLVELTLPSALPIAGIVRVTVSLTNGAIVRRFGPLILTVFAP